MEWQAIVFALQILLLAVSWVLFQKARAELSAKAVETPVLSEVRALQKNVKQLLAEIEAASDRSAAQLEFRCEKAQEALMALESKIAAADTLRPSAPISPARPKRTPRIRATAPAGWMAESEPAPQAVVSGTGSREQQEGNWEQGTGNRQEPKPALVSVYAARRQEVYALTDAGEPVAAIARKTGISEGEIETWIGLRKKRH